MWQPAETKNIIEAAVLQQFASCLDLGPTAGNEDQNKKQKKNMLQLP